MLISQLSAATGVPSKTIRYYEEIGVLPAAPRSPNGYRDYEPDAVDRLRFIRDAQTTGLSLAEIASIIDLRQGGARTCEHVVALLDRHLEELAGQIESLNRARTALASLRERASSRDPQDCTDPVRCQTIEGGIGIDSGVLHSPTSAHGHA